MIGNKDIDQLQKKAYGMIWIFISPFQMLMAYVTFYVFDTNKVLPLVLTLLLGLLGIFVSHKFIIEKLLKQYDCSKSVREKIISKYKLSRPPVKLFFIVTGTVFFATGSISVYSINEHLDSNEKLICCAKITSISKTQKRQNYYVKYSFVYNGITINGVCTKDLNEYNGFWNSPIGIPVNINDEYSVLIDSLKLQHNKLQFDKPSLSNIERFKQLLANNAIVDVAPLLDSIEIRYDLEGLIAYYHRSRKNLEQIDNESKSIIIEVLNDQGFKKLLNDYFYGEVEKMSQKGI